MKIRYIIFLIILSVLTTACASTRITKNEQTVVCVAEKGSLTKLTLNANSIFNNYLYGRKEPLKGYEYPAVLIYKTGQKKKDATPIDYKNLDKIKIEDISSIEISYDPQMNVIYGTRGLGCVVFIVLEENEN